MQGEHPLNPQLKQSKVKIRQRSVFPVQPCRPVDGIFAAVHNGVYKTKISFSRKASKWREFANGGSRAPVRTITFWQMRSRCQVAPVRALTRGFGPFFWKNTGFSHADT